MEIPLIIKRNYLDIKIYLDNTLDNHSTYIGKVQKEGFINKCCNALAVWFYISYVEFNITIDEIKKYFIYMFRTTLSIYWEKQNGVNI
jgi:hypothetical protein